MKPRRSNSPSPDSSPQSPNNWRKLTLAVAIAAAGSICSVPVVFAQQLREIRIAIDTGANGY